MDSNIRTLLATAQKTGGMFKSILRMLSVLTALQPSPSQSGPTRLTSTTVCQVSVSLTDSQRHIHYHCHECPLALSLAATGLLN